ncbi:uncharacterized protein LOC141904764 [Tubulanus polymorphus]
MDELKFYVTISNRKRLAGRGGNDDADWYGPMNYALIADLTRNIISREQDKYCLNVHFEEASRQWKKVGKRFDSIRCYARNTESSTVSNRTDDSGKRMTFMIRELFRVFNFTYSLPDCHLNEISGILVMPRRGREAFPKFDIKIDKLDAKELEGVKLCDKQTREISASFIPSLLPYPFNSILERIDIFDYL